MFTPQAVHGYRRCCVKIAAEEWSLCWVKLLGKFIEIKWFNSGKEQTALRPIKGTSIQFMN